MHSPVKTSAASPRQNRHGRAPSLAQLSRGHGRTQATAAHSAQEEAATAQALLKGLTQVAATKNSNQPPSPAISKKKKRSRSPYKCHKCGKPKKGHICTVLPSPALIKGRETRLISPSPTPVSPPLSHQPIQMDYYDPPSSPPVVLSQRSLAEAAEADEGEENYFSTSSLDLAAMFPVSNSTTTTTTTTTTTATTTDTNSASLGDLGEAVMWNTDALFTDSTDEDWAALGYIDERFPIGGVGVNLNSKKKVGIDVIISYLLSCWFVVIFFSSL